MDEQQRGWRERYDLADFEFRHFLALLAIVLIFAAPIVVVLRDGESGLVFFAVGFFSLIWAVALTSDK